MPKTGALRWSYKTGSLIESSPAVANGVVYEEVTLSPVTKAHRLAPVLASSAYTLPSPSRYQPI